MYLTVELHQLIQLPCSYHTIMTHAGAPSLPGPDTQAEPSPPKVRKTSGVENIARPFLSTLFSNCAIVMKPFLSSSSHP